MLYCWVYYAYLIVSYYQGEPDADSDAAYASAVMATKSLQCAIIFLTFIKLNSMLRIYDEFSYLVQLLLMVFKDLRYFLAFFGFFIITFTVFLAILLNGYTNENIYYGIGPVSYFAIALRTSIGDYDFQSFSANTQYYILTWLVWLFIMLVGNVIFMNFIIAVINQSYSNCMETITAQSYKVKLYMILEYEMIMEVFRNNKNKGMPEKVYIKTPIKVEEEGNSKIVEMLKEI